MDRATRETLLYDFYVCGVLLPPQIKKAGCRELPMLCIVYEGVIKGAIDFDYAPSSMLVSFEGRSRRRWLNISQEGKRLSMTCGRKVC